MYHRWFLIVPTHSYGTATCYDHESESTRCVDFIRTVQYTVVVIYNSTGSFCIYFAAAVDVGTLP
jgi:hypothetical protein